MRSNLTTCIIINFFGILPFCELTNYNELTMERITKKINIETPSDIAFQKFVNELNEWWPREYTWSGNKLSHIGIDGREGGFCTEIGPKGFRCDWGTVTEFIVHEKIGLKWQISPRRKPVPDPDKASDILVEFIQEGKITIVHFIHFNFNNHGEDADEYRE